MLKLGLDLAAALDRNLILPADKLSLRQAWLLALLAYAFAVAVRCFYPAVMLSIPGNLYDGLPILNNIDGYFFAHEANKLLTGHPQGDWQTLLSAPHMLSMLIYLLGAVGIWPVEQVIYFIPVVFAPLICLPLVFIGRALGSTWMGFIAALLASVTWSYYNRSLAGYLDTDTLSSTMPMLLVLGLIHLIQRRDLRSVLAVGITLYIYYYAYYPGIAIGLAMTALALVYLVWRDYLTRENHSPLLLLALAPAFISVFDRELWWLQGSAWLFYLAVISLIAPHWRQLPMRNQWLLALGLSAVCLAISPLVWQIWKQFFGYLNRGVLDAASNWSYYAVSGTVREAGQIPFSTFANRVAGSVPSYFFAMFAVVVVLARFRFLAFMLPMAAVGFFALFAGLRFTIYLIPLSMLGVAFVLLLWGQRWQHWRAQWWLPGLGTVLMLIPNLVHVYDYRPNITTPRAEIAALENLRAVGSTSDYMISWWDYGYDMSFFSGKNTIIDGGAHTDDNFIASTILNSDSQLLAARLMRAAAEIHAGYYDDLGRYDRSGSNLPTTELFGKRRPDFDPHELLREMRRPDYELPYAKTREVFLYLPSRILDIYRTIRLFSDLNLVTGQTYDDSYYLNLTVRSVNNNVLELFGGVRVDLASGEIIIGQERSDLRAFYQVYADANGSLQQNSSRYNSGAELSALLYQPRRQILLANQLVLRSNAIQMLVLGRYDPELFELVHRSPELTIFRLKI